MFPQRKQKLREGEQIYNKNNSYVWKPMGILPSPNKKYIIQYNINPNPFPTEMKQKGKANLEILWN